MRQEKKQKHRVRNIPLHFPLGAMFSFSQEKRKIDKENKQTRHIGLKTKNFFPIFFFFFCSPFLGKQTE
jgi:hypothetical protein